MFTVLLLGDLFSKLALGCKKTPVNYLECFVLF
jgi:hypothetical protein